MKPFELADVTSFDVDSTGQHITFKMPREGGSQAQLHITAQQLPKFMQMLFGAAQIAANHGPERPPMPEATFDTGTVVTPTEYHLIWKRGQAEGQLVFRIGHVDLFVRLDSLGLEALCQLLNRGG